MARILSDKRYLPVLVPLLLVVVIAVAFLLGRRSINADSTSRRAVSAQNGGEGHAAGEAGHAEGEAGHEHGAEEGKSEGGHGEEGAHAEEGVVKFDETSLKLAKLQVETVNRRSLQSRLALTGTVEPNLGGVVKVTPRVGGKITSVRVNMGDNVRAGEPLAVLASTELAEAQAQYQQAGVRVQLAQNNLQRQRRLAGLGEFGRPKVEESRANQVTAQGQVSNLRSELSEARNQVVEARSDKAAAEGEVAAAESAVSTAESEAASAQSQIAEAEGEVRALRAALEQAQTQVGVAESRFNRYETLLKEQLVSRQDWEQTQADLKRSRSDVEAARANIEQAQAKVTAARARQKATQSQIRSAQAKVRAEQGRVKQTEAKIETALAHQAQVTAQIETAERQAQIAAQGLAREERVYRGGFMTSKEIVEAESALRTARAEQGAAANTVRLLGGTPGGGNTLTVVAPIGGRVTERLVTLGETVTPEKVLFTVINLQSVWVQLAVQQKDLPVVRVGQSVAITSDTAPGRTFQGTVSYIGDAVDETTRTVKVRAVIQNPGGLLKPQTFVRGKIAADVQASILAVPREAVQTHEGKTVVFVAGDHPGEFEAKEVKTGDTVAGLTEITSGLEPGARVVTKGAFTVKAQAQKAELGHSH
jgi:cobalt-zinc-cadmium efflux system membrane fusion protein